MDTTLEQSSKVETGLENSSLETGTKPKKGGGVQSLLGEHSKLVNLDDLVSSGGGAGGSGLFPWKKALVSHRFSFITSGA